KKSQQGQTVLYDHGDTILRLLYRCSHGIPRLYYIYTILVLAFSTVPSAAGAVLALLSSCNVLSALLSIQFELKPHALHPVTKQMKYY
ncbi:hypothetical protein A2U01_0027427, partial [Trifolium medium]|nr:hypothetical protein [Trifolium medium]